MECVFRVRCCPEKLRCKTGTLVSAPEADRFMFGQLIFSMTAAFIAKVPTGKVRRGLPRA